jgi:hypothetical protein
LNTGIFLKTKCQQQTEKKKNFEAEMQQANKQRTVEENFKLLHLHTGSSNCIFRFIRRWGKSWGVWCKLCCCCCVEVVQLPWMTEQGCVCR